MKVNDYFSIYSLTATNNFIILLINDWISSEIKHKINADNHHVVLPRPNIFTSSALDDFSIACHTLTEPPLHLASPNNVPVHALPLPAFRGARLHEEIRPRRTELRTECSDLGSWYFGLASKFEDQVMPCDLCSLRRVVHPRVDGTSQLSLVPFEAEPTSAHDLQQGDESWSVCKRPASMRPGNCCTGPKQQVELVQWHTAVEGE